MGLTENLASTSSKVKQNTAPAVNAEIQSDTEQQVATHADDDAATRTARLRALDREWDIERLLQTNAAIISLLSVVLGFTVNRRWFLLAGMVATFLLQHAVQGWCPPLPIFRRLGKRTHAEIDEERIALRILNGDIKPTRDADEALAQARACV